MLIYAALIVTSQLRWFSLPFLSAVDVIYIHGIIRLSLSKADRRSEKKIDRSFRERERTKYSSYFWWGIYSKKFFLGTWKYVFEKIWYSCSVFWALSNYVIFINSARSWKFRTSWYVFAGLFLSMVLLIVISDVHIQTHSIFSLYLMYVP